MSTAIVIVNYRTADLTIQCLRSLVPDAGGKDGVRVFVVDNASGDGSVQRISEAIVQEAWGDWVQILPLQSNRGYAAGNNAGIQAALAGGQTPDYVLLLNPDTVVRPGAVQALAGFMDCHAAVGIAGSRLEDPDGTAQCSAHTRPSPLGELVGTAKVGPLTRALARYCVSPRVRGVGHPCDWVSGASLIIRTPALARIGLLDEGFFLYYEEVDLCLRARRAGWEVWYVPAAIVVHLEGAATGISAKGKRRAGYWYASRRRFFAKHYGIAGLLRADLMWVLGRIIYSVRHLGGLDAAVAADPKWFAWDLLWGDAIAIATGRTIFGGKGN